MIGKLTILEMQTLGQQFHQTATCGGQLEQRVDGLCFALGIGVDQQLHPALQLATPEDSDGVAQRGDLARHAAAHRVGQTQHVNGEPRLQFESLFNFAGLGVFHQQAEQAYQRELRRVQFLAGNDRWSGKKIALKQVEAKIQAKRHLLAGFHFLGE